jgi:hypothetical protein
VAGSFAKIQYNEAATVFLIDRNSKNKNMETPAIVSEINDSFHVKVLYSPMASLLSPQTGIPSRIKFERGARRKSIHYMEFLNS